MTENEKPGLKKYLFEHRFLYLMILIFATLVIGSFISEYKILRYFFDLVISAIFICAMYAIVEKMRHLAIMVCLAVPMFVSLWLKYFMEYRAILVIGELCGILFFAYSIVNIFKHIMNQKEITKETICAGIVIYLLMAFMWARAYSLLEVLYPGSFTLPEGHMFGNRYVYLYYSLVTISTLGYGDITPLTDKASGLAAIEAISGQIYLVVLVAWLVGMHVSKRSR
jgi:voltage-gated potassium channel